MRTIKTLLLVVALTFSGVLAASNNAKEKRAESVALTEEIGNLLKAPSFILDKEVLANVKVTINKNNEIVVLSVDTEENYISSFIKNRLNYNELPATFKSDTKTFIVPVRITPEE